LLFHLFWASLLLTPPTPQLHLSLLSPTPAGPALSPQDLSPHATDADLESVQLTPSQRPGPHWAFGDLALLLTQLESPTATGPLRDLARGLLSHGLQFGDLALPHTPLAFLTATGPHRDLARGLLSHGLLSGDQALLPTQLESPTATGPHRALMAKGLLVRRPQLRPSIPTAEPLMLVRRFGGSQ